MILEQNKANIETYGDIQQNKVSIDPRNAEHIISILSSNLYSNPEESFLRETISNAVDAHKEAGTKEPIILLFKKNGSNYDIVIRDFGTGISPERFNQIYKFIGSSTKRESNEYIGSFGIGRFSALAVADVVNITSYYDGTANSYVMAKNGGGIDIDLIASTKTDEKNGVEIKIQTRNIADYSSAIRSLAYISNLYIRIEGFPEGSCNYDDNSFCSLIDQFNNRKVFAKKHFKCNSFVSRREAAIILGNIVYPIDLSKIMPLSKYNIGSFELKNILRNIQIPFEIGSLDVTPNREALLYSPRTIQTLKSGIEEAIDEIVYEYEEFLKNNDNILDYYIQIRRNRSLKIANDDNSFVIDIPIPNGITSSSSLALSFKNYCINKVALDYIESILYHSLSILPMYFAIDCKGLMNTYRKNKTDIRDVLFKPRYSSCTHLTHSLTIVRAGSEEGTKSPLLRSYAYQKYKDKASDYVLFVPSCSAKVWINSIMTTVPYYRSEDIKPSASWVVKEIIKSLKDFIVDDDIANSEEFKTWKENRKATLKLAKAQNATTFDKPVIGYIKYDSYYSQRKYEFKNLTEFDTVLKNYVGLDNKERKKPVIYGELNDPYWDIFEELMPDAIYKRFIIVKFAKNNMKYFKNISKKWIDVRDYIPKSKEFIRYLTYRKYRDSDMETLLNEHSCSTFMFNIREYVTKDDHNALILYFNWRIPKFQNKDVEVLNEILNKCKQAGRINYDSDFKTALEVTYKYVKLYSRLKNQLSELSSILHSSLMFTYFLMKHKLLRMNFKDYSYLKDKLKITVQ